MKKWLSLLLALCMLLGLTGAMAEAAAPGLTKDLVVLFTSDVHCGIDQGFGYAGLAAVKQSMIDAGNHVLLVDNGDAVQGEPVGTVTTGSAIIELMNQVGYDIATPGNHEFDYGMDRFFELTKMAKFEYISCNFNKNEELQFKPYTLREFDGVKVGFVGITTPKTITSSTPRYFQDENGNFIYGFMQDETGEKLYAAVQKAVDDARAEGAQYIIVMAHIGNEEASHPWNYADVISHTNGINALVDGHSHDTDQVVMKNKDGEDVIRSACGTKLEGIGYIRIAAKDGKMTGGLYSWENKISAPQLLGINNDTSKAVAAATDELNTQLQKVVAKTAVDLTIVDPEAKDENGKPIRIIRSAETNLGDLCADAYLDQAGDADIAFVNGGGIRVSIPAGDITLGSILKVHPFGNSLTVIEVTGQQVLDALEWGAHGIPGENGGFLQVAGLTYEIHTYVPSPCQQDENTLFTGIEGERRVKNVMVKGEPIDPKKTYKLASHNYMLFDQGDGFTMFEGCKVLQESVKLDNQVLIDYITGTLGGVVGEKYQNPYGEGRIVAVEAAPAQ